MANGNRREIAPVRGLIAAVLGTVATFVILFGAGMTSWSIVALGFAVLVLAVALIAAPVMRSGARAWVTGSAHVHSVSEPPAAYSFGRCELQLVLDAPGLPPRSVKVIDSRVPVAKWPDVGQALPIKVAIDDPRHVRILWDEVPTHGEAATAAGRRSVVEDDVLDDDLLIQDDAPPWAGRPVDDEFTSPVEARSEFDDAEFHEEPVVVRQTPGGTIVLEGTVVEPTAIAPLPRRATSGPIPTPREGAREETADVDVDRSGDSAPAAAIPPGADPVPAPDAPDAPAAPPTTGHGQPVDLTLDEPAHPSTADPDDDALLADLTSSLPAGQAGAVGPISGVGITVLVTDLARSVAFYRDMLGFFEIDGGEGNAVLASGATRLVLRAIPDVAPINRRLVHLNLEVSDLESVYEDLRDKGVRFTYAPRAVNRGEKLELWAAAFRDPDGHGIALTQWRERAHR